MLHAHSLSELNLNFENMAVAHLCRNVRRSVTMLDDAFEDCWKDDIDNKPKSSEIPSEFDECGLELFEKMKYEVNRLISFENKWPCIYIKPEDLVEAGFFYLQTEDKVQCPFCHVIIYNWEDGDKPLREHMKLNPKCPFLMSSEVGNITSIQKRSSNVPNVTQRYDGASASVPLYIQTASIHTSYKPKHPRMSDVKRRLLTFKDWPLKIIAPQELAECGLYYTGVSDVVTCFFCGGSLGNWELDDNPWEEHHKHFGHCIFLSLAKNNMKKKSKMSFIKREKVLNASSETSQEKQTLSSSSSDAETKTVLVTDIIKQACDIFPESLVLNVILKYRNKYGKNVTSLSELCEEVLKFKETEERSKVHSEENLSKSEPGPIDSTNIGSTSALKTPKEMFLCKICMDQEMEVVFQPCGHLVSCLACSRAIADCPLCRKPIMNTVRTYLS